MANVKLNNFPVLVLK